MITLELGINVVNGDTMRERAFVAAFHGFLDTIRDGHPKTPILITSPIICPIAEIDQVQRSSEAMVLGTPRSGHRTYPRERSP